MWKQAPTLTIILLISAFSLFSAPAMAQGSDQITRPQLREMLVQLGYEVKDIVKDAGKEKYSVTLVKSGLDIPVGLEISPNSKYIWLTVNLGDAPKDTASVNQTLLKQNSKIQPSFFYITDKGRLMMGLPLDNRGITNAFLRDRVETISENVGKTKDIWQ